MLTTESDISTFLTLQKKSLNELKAIATSFNLPSNKTKDELIKSLMAQETDSRLDPEKPQVIPIRTMKGGIPIPGALEFVQKCRAVIFNGKTNKKDFKLLNNKGEAYSLKMKYALCSPATLKKILDHEMYFVHSRQQELIELVKKNPEQYNVRIVNKPRKSGGTFIMLHCERKS